MAAEAFTVPTVWIALALLAVVVVAWAGLMRPLVRWVDERVERRLLARFERAVAALAEETARDGTNEETNG